MSFNEYEEIIDNGFDVITIKEFTMYNSEYTIFEPKEHLIVKSLNVLNEFIEPNRQYDFLPILKIGE